MAQVAVVGMGIAVPGASSPEELWRLLSHGDPVFREPGARYRLDGFWSADPAAQDRGYVRESGFLTDLRPHPRLADELNNGEYGAADRKTIWLRHCLLQAQEPVTVHTEDRQACVLGGSDIVNQRLDETIVIESVAHRVAAKLSGEVDERGRLRTLLRQHFGHPDAEPHELVIGQILRATLRGLLPEDCRATVVDAACSSSLYALNLGVRLLQEGECEIAYCGGISEITPRYNVCFAKLGGLSRSGQVRVFDRAADGTLFSDGAAMVALKTVARARADGDDILGVVAGLGSSSDGRGKAIYAPHAAGQIRCIERARDAAGMHAEDVDWVISHGTGTPAGDRRELEALAATARPDGFPCVSNKATVGHSGWCAGTVSVIHALLALRHERIPAQRGFGEAAPDSSAGDLVRIPTSPLPWARRDGRPRTVGVSAFGFGGTNGHLLIQEHRPVPRISVPSSVVGHRDPVVLLAWSAHLPGDPGREEISRLLATGAWRGPKSFGVHRPPTFDELQLPARTLETVDPAQVMALRVTASLIAENGELWASVRETTGVVAASVEPSPFAISNLLRCYGADLEPLFAGADAKAFAAVLGEFRGEAPPTSKDTLPGILPNIIAARIAHQHDLHGLTMVVDSGDTAVRTAELLLRDGELDVALVLGVNTGVLPELAALADPAGIDLAEGAFLVALARQSLARAHGWPVLAELEPCSWSQSPAVRPGTSFRAADGILTLLRRTLMPRSLTGHHRGCLG